MTPFTCHHCKILFYTEPCLITKDGRKLCDDCARYFVICDKCSNSFHEEDMHEVTVDGGKHYEWQCRYCIQGIQLWQEPNVLSQAGKGESHRPILFTTSDLENLVDLVSAGNPDIANWMGGLIGHDAMKKVFEGKEFPEDDVSFRMGCEELKLMGFGKITLIEFIDFEEVKVRIEQPLETNSEENQQVFRDFYEGMMYAMLDYMGFGTMKVTIEY
ncbi:MAG: hypothetical protein ACFFCS_01885 [Candidatus Hodarchaeota archaeon]